MPNAESVVTRTYSGVMNFPGLSGLLVEADVIDFENTPIDIVLDPASYPDQGRYIIMKARSIVNVASPIGTPSLSIITMQIGGSSYQCLVTDTSPDMRLIPALG